MSVALPDGVRFVLSRTRPAQPKRPLSLAETMALASDLLTERLPIAGDERRRHAQTEQLLDDVHQIGQALCRASRGRG